MDTYGDEHDCDYDGDDDHQTSRSSASLALVV